MPGAEGTLAEALRSFPSCADMHTDALERGTVTSLCQINLLKLNVKETAWEVIYM